MQRNKGGRVCHCIPCPAPCGDEIFYPDPGPWKRIRDTAWTVPLSLVGIPPLPQAHNGRVRHAGATWDRPAAKAHPLDKNHSPCFLFAVHHCTAAAHAAFFSPAVVSPMSASLFSSVPETLPLASPSANRIMNETFPKVLVSPLSSWCTVQSGKRVMEMSFFLLFFCDAMVKQEEQKRNRN